MGDRGQTQVKNKQPAPMQVTAEQILREARERQEDENYTAPAQKITDPEELAVYRLKERKHFEDRLRMSKHAIGTWLKYAAFEEQQRDFERARSVYERAIDVDHRNTTLWLKYAEMEMRNRHINHARNVWDRAVTLMPRVDQFWFKVRAPRRAPAPCAHAVRRRAATCAFARSRCSIVSVSVRAPPLPTARPCPRRTALDSISPRRSRATVHLHGGDARQRHRGTRRLRSLDRVGAGRSRAHRAALARSRSALGLAHARATSARKRARAAARAPCI